MLHAFYFLLGTGDHDQNVPLNHIYNISPLYTSARIVTSLIDFIDTFWFFPLYWKCNQLGFYLFALFGNL